ncbi:MAG: helix-turn-helix domain-containing protein [Myxococcales bacterium]|nr:helix-turn-helix domain-containing protein [Myxococcales bacterium]MDD9968548.1 helix-turn-helix domain-containing protein [Myxococcales bacterium]
MEREYLIVEEVADKCRAPVVSVRRWLQQGLIPSIKVGRRRLVRADDLTRFMEASSPRGSEASR